MCFSFVGGGFPLLSDPRIVKIQRRTTMPPVVPNSWINHSVISWNSER